MKDITPELLRKINKEFDDLAEVNRDIEKYLNKLKQGKATFADANKFSVEIGNILSSVLKSNLKAELLPDERMYFNIANRIFNSTLQKNYKLVSKYSTDVQKLLNTQANIHLKVKKPLINQNRIDGFINRISSEENFDNIKWIIDDPIVNFTQSVVDDVIKSNVDFHAQVGLQPTLRRTVAGRACKWCSNLAGSYKYPDDVPSDIYHRHERCRCMVEYLPGNGKKQDIWTKKITKIKPTRKVINQPKTSFLSEKRKWQQNYNRKNISVQEKTSWETAGKKYKVDGKKVILSYSKEEKKVADFISKKLGVKVEMVPRVLYPPSIKTPDYLINGIPFDLKQVEGHGKNVIDGMLRKKDQSHNFIFDIKKTTLSIEEIFNQFNRIYSNPLRSYLNTVILIDGDTLVDILNRK